MHLLTAPMFGAKHLWGLAFVILLNIALFVIFNKTVKSERRLLLIALIGFYAMEVLKISFLIIRDGSFPLNHIPLHLCSIPLYVFPILYWVKPTSWWHQAAKVTAFAVVLIAGVTALVIPVNIIGDNDTWFPLAGNFLPVLSFIFHGFMVFVPWYMYRRGYVQVGWSSIPPALALTSMLMAVALIVDFAFDKDYMLLHTGNGSPLVFLRDDFGQLPYTLSMILLGYVVITLVFAVTIGIRRLKQVVSR